MKIKVLVADDETDFAEALGQRLNIRNFHTVVVTSGAEALNLLKKEVIDVAVLDVMMPGISGTQVLDKIRNDYPLVKVILLTGHGTIENAVNGMKSGAFDYVLKPADVDSLSLKINDAYKLKADQEAKIKKAEINCMITRKGW